MHPISFPHAGETLTGTLFMPQTGTPPFPGVIFFHGMTSSEKSYLPMAKALSENGIAALTVNIRGHGDSSGTIEETTGAEFETDGIAAYDFFAKQRGIDPDRIGICGGSFGALLAAMISDVRPVRSIVLRAPAAYTPEMRQEKMGEILKREMRVFHEAVSEIARAPAIEAIRKFTGSVLVVASELDTHIPREMAQAYYDNVVLAKRREFEVLKGAEHSLQNDEVKQRFTGLLMQWFAETL
jgi:uncharacterized protein